MAFGKEKGTGECITLLLLTSTAQNCNDARPAELRGAARHGVCWGMERDANTPHTPRQNVQNLTHTDGCSTADRTRAICEGRFE
ncbi:hypothetical protein DdX_06889 [Ditylenchus destructor]|uniref:Uncharacterized protein n=1 Tax=Ditylenchus destructor TaxID=166010 RepID=A0AAD4N8C7_9BILA|nr:hypothetical protein DdX_06889 [Ditylenchus destructor]